MSRGKGERGVLLVALLGLAAFISDPSLAEDPAPTADKVPPALLGEWRLTHEVCDQDSEGEPDPDLPPLMLYLHDDHNYAIALRGWILGRGTFTVEKSADRYSLRLDDTWQDFDLVDGELQNWSEGEAVYLCGKVFEKVDRY